MKILTVKPTDIQLTGKYGGAQIGQKSSVFPNLRSPEEIGRISPQRPLSNFWSVSSSARHEGASKLKGKNRFENTLLRGISEKVVKLYRKFQVTGDE